MIKFKAIIEFYDNSLRKTAFRSGYRPGFIFKKGFMTTGQITLIDKIELNSGESCLAEIIPITQEYLGENFGVGSKFTFYEGKNIIGGGTVESII